MSDNVKIGAEVELDPKSTQNIKTLKQQLRDALKEAQILSSQDLGSKEAVAAQKRVAALRDSIEDTNESIAAFTGAGQFKAIGNAVQGIAGGFAAAQGAIALFGGESEDLQKTLVRLNAAMAFSQGLSQIEGLKDSFSALGRMIKTNVLSSLTTLKGALIATGIGAAAVLIGTLVANWQDFTKAIREAFPAFKVVEDFFGNIKQIAAGTLKSIVEGFKVVGDVIGKIFDGDFSGAIESAKDFGKRVATAYNQGYDEKDNQLKKERAIKDKKFELDLEEAKGKDIKAKRVKLMREELELLEKGSEEYNNKLIEIETLRTEIRDQNAEKQKQIEENKAKKLKEIEDERLRQLEINIEFEKMKIQQLIESHKSAFDEIKKGTDSAVSEIEGLRNKAFESINDTRTSNETKLNILKEYLQAGYITEQEYTEKAGNLEVQKIENQRQLANESFGILQNINTLAGENFETQKGISIAQTGVDTFESSQSVFKAASKSPITTFFPAYPFVAAGLAITAGLARIRQMAQIRPGVRSFSGGGSTSTPSAPSFTPAQGTNVEGAGNVNLSSQANASRVYVLESDIRSTTSRVDVIQSNAMFK
jgi:hypothetical protein